jgi:hypothetical protein
MQEGGICVACIATRQCACPQWLGTPRCGRDRAHLPDRLYLEPPLEEAPVGQAYLDQVRQEAAYLDQWKPALLEAARRTGLDEQAMEFLEGLELLGEPPRGGSE